MLKIFCKSVAYTIFILSQRFEEDAAKISFQVFFLLKNRSRQISLEARSVCLSLSLFLSAAAFQSRHFSCRCQLQRRPDVVVVAKSANASIASCLSQNRLFGPLMLYFFPPAFVLKTECIFRDFLSLPLSFFLSFALSS